MNLPYESLPLSLRSGMERYLEDGVTPGSFLTAVLENDLFGAIIHADDDNRHRLRMIVMWVNQHLPAESWGSKDHVKHWKETACHAKS